MCQTAACGDRNYCILLHITAPSCRQKCCVYYLISFKFSKNFFASGGAAQAAVASSQLARHAASDNGMLFLISHADLPTYCLFDSMVVRWYLVGMHAPGCTAFVKDILNYWNSCFQQLQTLGAKTIVNTIANSYRQCGATIGILEILEKLLENYWKNYSNSFSNSC